MNFNYNKVFCAGRLTATPELKTTTSGLYVTNFTVACNGFGRDAKTTFLPCVAWKEAAENLCRYCRKGDTVFIEGKFQPQEYTANDGSTRSKLEINCLIINYLETGNADSTQDTSGIAKGNPTFDYEEVEDAELPF